MARPLSSSSGAPRNLLITKPEISAWSSGDEQGQRAVHGGEHPAAVDVADHDDRQAGRPGQAHVGHVGVAQVDLGRAARALADDHVVGVPQPGQAVQRDLPQPRRVRAVAHRVGFGLGVAEHDDLAAPVAARLEQHRVHVGGRLDAGRGRLHRLGAADLGAVQRSRTSSATCSAP